MFGVRKPQAAVIGRDSTLLLVRAASFLLQVAVLALIGHEWGPPVVGAYVVFVAWQGIPAAIATAGLSVSTLRASGASGSRADTARIIRTLLFRELPRRIAVVSLGVFVFATVAVRLDLTILPIPVPSSFVWIVGASTATTVFVSIMGDVLAGSGHPILASVSRTILQRVFFACLIVLGLSLEGELPASTLFAAYLVSSLVPAVGLLLWSLKRLEPTPDAPFLPGADFTTRWISRLWGFQVLQILVADLPTAVLPAFLDPDATGYVGVALRLSQGPAMVMSALVAAYGPGFSRAFAQGSRKFMAQLLKQSQAWGTAVAVPMLASVALIPSSWYGVLGEEMELVKWPLFVLLLGQIVNAATGLVGYALVMVHKESVELRAQLCSFVSLLLFLPLGAHYWGTLGYCGVIAASLAGKNVLSWKGWRRWYSRWNPHTTIDINIQAVNPHGS